MTRTQLHRMARFNGRPEVIWLAPWPYPRMSWPSIIGMLAVGLALIVAAVWR